MTEPTLIETKAHFQKLVDFVAFIADKAIPAGQTMHPVLITLHPDKINVADISGYFADDKSREELAPVCAALLQRGDIPALAVVYEAWSTHQAVKDGKLQADLTQAPENDPDRGEVVLITLRSSNLETIHELPIRHVDGARTVENPPLDYTALVSSPLLSRKTLGGKLPT